MLQNCYTFLENQKTDQLNFCERHFVNIKKEKQNRLKCKVNYVKSENVLRSSNIFSGKLLPLISPLN